MPDEKKPAEVPKRAKQAGEGREREWSPATRQVWTERMLEALERGVKGGVWFSLIDKVHRPKTLAIAWETVKMNKGSAGVDHQNIEAFERNLEHHLRKLEEELREGKYEPSAVKRPWIDKPGSKDKRPLGIPTVRDRVVQSALRMTIEPIFEKEFHPSSYGFRPGRGCKDALREVDLLLKEGYTWVVDADIRKYFDTIPHDKLMTEVKKRIADGRVLELIEAFLKQRVLDELNIWEPEEGTPQGGVISPLLANIYLHPVDEEVAKAGYRMIRYADDFVIICRSKEDAERAMELIRVLMDERGLTLHPDKTRILDMGIQGNGFDFLGYHFTNNRRWPREKSMNKLKDAVREKTRKTNGNSMEFVIRSLNPTLRGWFEYFKHSRKWVFRKLDGWIRRRLRSILRKRQKRKGISRGWDNQRWPNAHFHGMGLFCLEKEHALVLQSLRGNC